MCVWRARFVQRHSRLIIFCTTRADMISKGNYPWAQSAGRSDAAAGGGSRTHAQLVTQLRMHVSEMERATEEKTRLEEERDRCLAYLTHQAGAVAAAVERARARQAALVERASDVPPCASQGRASSRRTQAITCKKPCTTTACCCCSRIARTRPACSCLQLLAAACSAVCVRDCVRQQRRWQRPPQQQRRRLWC